MAIPLLVGDARGVCVVVVCIGCGCVGVVVVALCCCSVVGVGVCCVCVVRCLLCVVVGVVGDVAMTL